MPDTTTVYPLLGRPHDSLDRTSKHYNISFPTYHGANYDASTTNLSYTIPVPGDPYGGEGLELTISFLSPITPTSTLRQALPASYITVHARGDFAVSVYVDINGQWVSGDRGSDLVWDIEESDNDDETSLSTFRVKREHELLFTEHQDRAEWGELYFTGPSDVSFEAGTSGDLRTHFAKTGSLKNKIDDKFRQIMDEEPVFAFSKNFNFSSSSNNSAQSSKQSDSVLFTIAHIQNPVTQFASARGLTFMRPLWKSYYFSASEMIAFHYTDYPQAFALAQNYSSQLASDAFANGGSDYVDIVSLSARQVMGATTFSGTAGAPLLFLKEISSNGNCQTIDVIFPSFPFFLYTNPRWLVYLLEPLLEHMGSGQYPNDYAMHDLGAHFPNFTGHPRGNDEYMPVEECGDIIIMGLALVNSLVHGDGGATGSVWSSLGRAKSEEELKTLVDDVSPFALPIQLETRDGVVGLDDQWGGATSHHQARKWLLRSSGLWKQWTGYLVKYSLEPANQLCTDDFAGWLALQTNLALKGIVGIKAMSKISEIVGEDEDAKYYRNISETYVEKWESYGMSRDGGRAKLAYDWYGSWTTLYSLYADAVLCFHPHSDFNETASPLAGPGRGQQHPFLPSHSSSDSKNFIPDHIYTTQSRWYSTVMQTYGLPLDSRHLYTKSDWEFQAAPVASRHTRKQILERVAKWVNETETDRPFSDLYKTEGKGGFPDQGPRFFARPVVGSHFAALALERACGGMAGRAFEYDE